MGQSATSFLFEEPNTLVSEEAAIQQASGSSLKEGIFLIEFTDHETEKGIILFEVENLKPGVKYRTLDSKTTIIRVSRTEIKINEQVVPITKRPSAINHQIEKELREIDLSKIDGNHPPPPQSPEPILSDADYKRKQVEELELYKLKQEKEEKEKLEKEKEA